VDLPYRLERSTSGAAEFHARLVPEPAERVIWWHEVSAPALVLGSTQSESIVDVDACRAAGVDVVRRRSGGGAVLLRPAEVTWIDVVVPRGAPGWADDVHAPMVWLGEHLAATLRSLLPEPAITVHDAPMVSTDFSALVCFDGFGAGEVLLDGHKLVGISQRRTRHAARLQCCWYSTHDPADLVELLAVSVRPPVESLQPVATVPAEVAAAIPTDLAARL
jgi:lipoate-protein ligase A